MTKRESNIIILSSIILLFLFYFLKGQYNHRTIERNISISSGKIIGYHIQFRGFVLIKYNFFFKNKLFSSDKILDYGDEHYFINKYFPVVFSNKNPEVNEILIFSDDFKKYNMTYPDSLHWTEALK